MTTESRLVLGKSGDWRWDERSCSCDAQREFGWNFDWFRCFVWLFVGGRRRMILVSLLWSCWVVLLTRNEVARRHLSASPRIVSHRLVQGEALISNNPLRHVYVRTCWLTPYVTFAILRSRTRRPAFWSESSPSQASRGSRRLALTVDHLAVGYHEPNILVHLYIVIFFNDVSPRVPRRYILTFIHPVFFDFLGGEGISGLPHSCCLPVHRTITCMNCPQKCFLYSVFLPGKHANTSTEILCEILNYLSPSGSFSMEDNSPSDHLQRSAGYGDSQDVLNLMFCSQCM